MEMSEQINELAAALAEARKEFAPFEKGHTAKVTSTKGTSYAYKYGDLADLFDATTPALSKYGLSISQWPDVTAGEGFVLFTFLLHKSGQWMRGRYPLATYERPQEQGSALTYAKRYAAGSVMGIAAELDDDGAAASGRNGAIAGDAPYAPRTAAPPATANGSRPAAQRPTAAAPQGYDDWLSDLGAVADEGTARLQKMWAASKPEYRRHLTDTNPAGWNALKDLAARKAVA